MKFLLYKFGRFFASYWCITFWKSTPCRSTCLKISLGTSFTILFLVPVNFLLGHHVVLIFSAEHLGKEPCFFVQFQ